MSVLEITPHISSEIDPSQLEPYNGLRVEEDATDPNLALLEISDFNTLNTIEHLLSRVVEVSPDTLTTLEEQKATKLKNTLRADVDATLDGEHKEGPYRHKVEVDEANVVLHAIALKIEQDAEKKHEMLWGKGYTPDAFDWLYDPSAHNAPTMVAKQLRVVGSRQQQIMNGKVEDGDRIYYDRNQS